MTTSAEAKATALEGLDFIETEEDVKAVEAATLKIQSTFRGKKIRSKLTPAKADADKPADATGQESAAAVNKSAGQQQASSKSSASAASKHKAAPTPLNTTATKSNDNVDVEPTELSKRVAEMQVNDSNEQQPQAGLPEEERAATKIQAGFKGYKTRKELEGKLSGGPVAPADGTQQAAPDGASK